MAANTEDRIDSEKMLNLLDQGAGKYLYVNVVSKRCKQIIAGSPKLAEPPRDCCMLADVAAEEIRQAKLSARPLAGNKLVRVPTASKRDKGGSRASAGTSAADSASGKAK